MNPTDWLVPLLLVYPILYASIFLHEVGHAVAGRAVGFVIGSFGLGTARPMCVVPVAGIRVYLAAVRPFQGITFAFAPGHFLPRTRMAAFAAGGILANATGVALSLAAWRWMPWGGPIWAVAAAMNGLMGTTSLVPFQVRIGTMPLRSDGALILHLLRTGTFSAEAPATIQTLDQLRDLWGAIGDVTTLRVFLLVAADGWLQLGDRPRAEALVEEADSVPDAWSPDVRASGDLVRSQVAIAAGRPDDAERALDSAEAHHRSERHAAALLLVATCRAHLRQVQDDPRGALADLDALATDPLVARHPDLGMSLLVARLSAAADADDPGAVASLRASFESARAGLPSATRDLQVEATLARFHARRGEAEEARSADRRLLRAIGEVAASWPDPETRARFLEARSATIEEARLRLSATIGPEEAERVVADLTNPAPSEAKREHPRYRRWGVLVLAADVAIAVMSATLSLDQDHPTSTSLMIRFFALLFGTFTTLGVLTLAVDLIARRVAPSRWPGAGRLTLLLACIPWITTILIFLITQFPRLPD